MKLTAIESPFFMLTTLTTIKSTFFKLLENPLKKSKVEDFEVLVKKLSKDFAELLKGMLLTKKNNKNLGKNLQDVTKLKDNKWKKRVHTTKKPST